MDTNTLHKRYKNLSTGISLGVLLSSCATPIYDSFEGNAADAGEDRCALLCEKVWADCRGLPEANYWFGTSYADCRAGCPDFLQGVESSPYRKKLNAALDCIIETAECSRLEGDSCQMDEGDLFERYSL